MKIVINDCYGGFEMSPQAISLYCFYKGIPINFYKQTQYKHEDKIDIYEKIKKEDIDKENGFLIYPTFKETEDKIYHFPECYFNTRNIKRNDLSLVRVVEELGEKSSGPCSKLKVEEIEDGSLYKIKEYDGLETIVSMELDERWEIAKTEDN